MNLVSRHEKSLFVILMIVSCIVWLTLILGTIGIALVYILFFYVFFLFSRSALISYLKGNAVKITEEVFPDLHKRVLDCCQKLNMETIPETYVLQAGGLLNAFAVRFVRKNFVVLYSDIVDAMEEKPGALNFYIGHELGHIDRGHLFWGPVLAPGSLLPLAGAAYSRAREKTCDNYGLHCCENANDAVAGLAAMATGPKRWKKLSVKHYMNQVNETGGFWMSFNELIAGYPWTVKRVARIVARAQGQTPEFPSRNPGAWFLAFFVPNAGGGGTGGLVSLMVIIAIIGILAAIAIPNFISYRQRSYDTAAMADVKNAYTASMAFFCQYPDGEVTTRALRESGFRQTHGVITEIFDGRQNYLYITTRHKQGGTKYTIDAKGRISTERTSRNRY